MPETTLVLSDQSLSGQKLHRDIELIKTAKRFFGLDADHTAFDHVEEISTAASVLCSRAYLSTSDLLYLAIAKKLTSAEMREIDEFGAEDTREDVKIWRKFDRPEIAGFLDAYYDLADDVEIEIIREDGGVWPEIANMAAIQERMEEIRTRIEPLEAEAVCSVAEMEAALCSTYSLELRPIEAFNQYWISRITEAPGFLSFEPEQDEDSWSLANEPYGWLTKRHGAALGTHGYRYKFAFWKQEIGEMRGHLWIQTDQGPLRLTDHTDAASQRSYFPVSASRVDGEPLFELLESDVPTHLLRDQPETPPELSVHASKGKSGNADEEAGGFWSWISRLLFRRQ